MKELLDFMRIRVSLSVALIAVSGYLLYNSPGFPLMFAALGAFFLSCGSYGYNGMTDKDEDRINGHGNPLVSSGGGRVLVFFCFSLGLVFSSLLGLVPAAVSVSITASALIYSRFRLKRYFLVKNLYTGFAVSQAVILGAAILSFDVLWTYFILSFFLFIGSIVSDLRDWRGDKASGIMTIPVRLGPGKARMIIYLLLACFAIIFLGTGTVRLLPLFILIPFIYVLILKDRPGAAHACGGISILFLTLWAFILNVLVVGMNLMTILFESSWYFLFIIAVYHSLRYYGKGRTAYFFLPLFLLVFIVEEFSVSFFHGFYYPGYQAYLIQVPLSILLGWCTVVYFSYNVSKRINGGNNLIRISFVAAMIGLSIDLVLEPLAYFWNLWVWNYPDIYFNATFENFIGWFLIIFIFSYTFNHTDRKATGIYDRLMFMGIHIVNILFILFFSISAWKLAINL